MVTVAKSLWIQLRTHQQQHRLLSDGTSKRRQINNAQWHGVRHVLLFFHIISNALTPGCRFRRSSIDVSLGSAIGSDVAPQRKHSLSVLPLPPLLVLPWARIMPRFGADSLAVSGHQTVQFTIFTFHHELVTSSIVIACLFAQMSHLHWAGPRVRLLMTVTTCTLICALPGNRCCCAVNSPSRSVGHMARRIASRISFGCWCPVRFWCRCSRFPRLGWCPRGRLF